MEWNGMDGVKEDCVKFVKFVPSFVRSFVRREGKKKVQFEKLRKLMKFVDGIDGIERKQDEVGLGSFPRY
jgi:hypothetical protein